jgi:hypothetical protein
MGALLAGEGSKPARLLDTVWCGIGMSVCVDRTTALLLLLLLVLLTSTL